MGKDHIAGAVVVVGWLYAGSGGEHRFVRIARWTVGVHLAVAAAWTRITMRGSGDRLEEDDSQKTHPISKERPLLGDGGVDNKRSRPVLLSSTSPPPPPTPIHEVVDMSNKYVFKIVE